MSNFTYDINALDVDENKKLAIQTTEGPLLIIAGPGSGKTKTLVERVVYLISKGVEPEEIMVATFTEKAAKELITRVSNRLLELNVRLNLNEMYIGTLHSIFLRFLEEHREFTRLKRSYGVFDQFDQRYFIYNNIRSFTEIEHSSAILGSYQTSNWEKAETAMDYVNKVSEEYLDVPLLLASDNPSIKVIGELYQTYDRLIQDENALDFSTIQVETLRMLENNPQVLASLQDKIRYIMIDEYQDTNTIQERILLLLADKNHNLCVVGDDDQGLYRFRGATIRNILEFPGNFNKGECKKVTLSVNYRSNPGIIDFYNRWMKELNWSENGKTFRFDKTIQAEEKSFPKIDSVMKVSSDQSLQEYYEEVHQFIQFLEEKKILKDRNQVAFLYNSVKNAKVIGLANYLESHGIDIFSPRSALFFQREEVRLLIGSLVFIFPDLFEMLKWSDDAHLQEWDYYESCKMQFAEEIRANPKQHEHLLKWCQKRAKEHLTLSGKTTYGFAALVYQMLEYPLFSRYLDSDLKGNVGSQRAAYNIALFTKLLYKFEYLHNVTVISATYLQKNLQDLFNKFLRFIIDGGIEEYEDFDEYAPSGCVSFMTIHQSKGLEFPVTMVGSLGTSPRKQYTEIDELLQNDYYRKKPFEPIEKTKYYDYWRLYYTAFSRAQDLLILSDFEEYKKDGEYKVPKSHFHSIYNSLPSWRKKQKDLAQLTLHEVKPVNLKHEYSFTSHILLYEQCPLQYKFYKVLEFTEVRTGAVLGGLLLHHTIEDIHRAVLKGEAHLVTDENITAWFSSNYNLLSKQQRGYLHKPQQEALLRQILKYKERQEKNWDRIKEAEVDVSLVKEDYILSGTIDLIEGEKGTVELIDFKSGDKPDVNASDPLTVRMLDRYKRQLEVYAHLVEERTDYKVSRLHLYYPKEEQGSPYVTFPANPEKINQTITSFDRVVKKIEKKDFDTKHIVRNEKQCGSCDMRYYCNPRQYN
jgi:DNA helicase-2/ATP-dependent DNA helicase PcrA